MADSINAVNGQGMSLQFEKFAQLAASASKGSSEVRFLGYDGAATVRDVVVTTSDKVGKIGRSVSVKEANNTTRAIFRPPLSGNRRRHALRESRDGRLRADAPRAARAARRRGGVRRDTRRRPLAGGELATGPRGNTRGGDGRGRAAGRGAHARNGRLHAGVVPVMKCRQCESIASYQSQSPIKAMGKLGTGNIGIGNIRTLATFNKATFGNLPAICV